VDRQRIINLIAAIAAITVFGFTLGLMFPLLSLIMEARGASSDLIGYNAAMQPLGIVISVLAIPPLVRRFGAQRVVIVAGVATAAIVVTYPFVPVFWWWFGLRFLHGFAVSMLFAISEAWIVRFAEGPYRSRIVALYTSILAASFGGGPILISLTGTATPAPFLIGATILILAIIPVLFVRDAPVDSTDEEVLSVVSFSRKAPMLLAAVAIFAVVDAANLGFLPVYGVKKGASEEMAAFMLTVFIIGNTVLQFPIGWLADHFPKRRVMASCGIATALLTATVPLAYGSALLWPVLMLAGAASAGIYTVALADLGDRFSGHELVTGTAAFSVTWGSGAFAGAMVAGWSIAAFGPDGFPFTIAAVMTLFLVLARAATTVDKRE